MANDLQSELTISTAVSVLGDMLSDMKAAHRANCKYLHYLCGYQNLKVNSFAYGGHINSLWEIQEYINLI